MFNIKVSSIAADCENWIRDKVTASYREYGLLSRKWGMLVRDYLVRKPNIFPREMYFTSVRLSICIEISP